MQFLDIMLIVGLVLIVLVAALFFLNRFASKKMGEHQSLIDQNKMLTSLFVIEKRRAKPEDSRLPKAALDQMPKLAKMQKLNVITAKVGPQILTLICDKAIYEVIPVKKTVKAELAGMYIVELKGIKTKKQLKTEAKKSK